MQNIGLPPGIYAWDYHSREKGRFRYEVLIGSSEAGDLDLACRDAQEHDPDAITARITHRQGHSWPNEAGEVVMRTVLAQGGFVVLAFATMHDAETCWDTIRDQIVRRGAA
jgi:hypothetical protein